MTKERLWLPALVLAATAYTGVGIQGPPESPSSTGPRPGRPECPHEWDFKSGQMALVGPNINVPEFHDCQRFIVYRDTAVYGDTAAVYDSLFAIFAAHSLDSLDIMLSQLDTTRSGTVAFAAAEIYAEGDYAQLGIGRWFNCLYLYRLPNHGLRAKMVTMGRKEIDCSERVNPMEVSGTDLAVQVRQLPGFYEQDVPPVARWDWDRNRHIQIIGIKCGIAWCEIGPPSGFSGMPTPTLPTGAGQKLRRTRMIKGWYDQQLLAEVTPSGDVRPSHILGTIWPDSGLDDYDTLTAFKRGQWVHVADIAMWDLSNLLNPPSSSPYKARMNLDFTRPNGPLNSIYLCRGTKDDCHPVVNNPCDGDGQWWARVDDATPEDHSRPRYICDLRRAHDGLGGHVPGTARWRWLASDETTWQRCDNGCCELKS